jgi:hypothetical protein
MSGALRFFFPVRWARYVNSEVGNIRKKARTMVRVDSTAAGYPEGYG